MADPPPTPPRSSSGSSKSTPNVNQGNVRNSDIENNGGVITGNVAGFNTIVGTLNITVDSAADLTNNIQHFTTRVATAAQRLRDVEAKIRATSQLLSSIRDLVVARAARDNIPVDRGFRAHHEDQTGDAVGNSSGEGERGGSAAGDDSGLEPDQPDGGQDISERSCFRDLINASNDAAERFNSINTTIREAFSRIEHVQRGPNKVELSEEDRQRLSLTERDIDRMERQIDCHRWEVHIALTAFEATMSDERSETIQTIILEMFKEIRRIGKHFVDRIREPRPFLESPPSSRGPNELHEIPIYGQDHHQWTFLGRRPFVFPDLSRLTSLYLGWTFTKGRPDNDTTSTQPSWRWAICTQMTLSTEELFLKVLIQTNRRSKLQRSIQDDLKDLLGTSVQRMLVDELIRGQNMSLSMHYPFLKLKLAGLACKKRKIGWFKYELKSIDVILKTEWALGSPPSGPTDAGGGQPPPSPSAPGFDDSPYGPGRPLGPGSGSGGSGSRHPGGGDMPDGSNLPDGGDSRPVYHRGPGPTPPPRRKTKPPGGTSPKTHPRTGPSNSAPEVVSREPRGYDVRKKSKGKAAASESQSSRPILIRDKRGHSKIQTEVRRPTSSRAENIHDGSSVSVQSDLPSSAQPGPDPETMPAFTRKMTAKEEQEIVDEIFAAWEEGVNGKKRKESARVDSFAFDLAASIPAPPSPSPRPSRNGPPHPSWSPNTSLSHKRANHRHHHPGKQIHYSPQVSAPVPPIGAPRRLMLEVERLAEKQEVMEKKMRAMHAHERSTHQYQTREPRERHPSTHPGYPRTSKGPQIIIDGDASYEYVEVQTPHAERAQSHQDFAVPGPSRGYSPTTRGTRTREQQSAQVDGWDPRDGVRRPSRRQRESFRSSGVDSYTTGVGVDSSERDASIRVMPMRTMERERARTRPSPINVVTPEPERHERERGARILEVRSPRGWSSESDSDELYENSE